MAHSNLGLTYGRQGKMDDAMREYKEAPKIDPTDSAVHGSLGSVYDQQGKMDDAIREYKEALRIDPNDSTARGSLARTIVSKARLTKPDGNAEKPWG